MTTLSATRQVLDNLPRWQTLTAKTPAVATAVAYFNAHIGDVKSAKDLIANPRLFTFAMQAFGLDDMVAAKGLMRRVLDGGVSDPQALANTLGNPKILAFAKAFDFERSGEDTTTTAAATSDVVASYVRGKLEANEGAKDKGVQLALYFMRKAPAVTSIYGVLADKTLLSVVQTALGISPMTSAQNIDVQAANLKRQLKVEDFADPKKLGAFVARFAARYDAAQGSSAAGAATTSGGGPGLSADLILSLQSYRRF